LPAQSEKITRARADIEAAIRAFTDADWARLHMAAKSFVFGTGWDFGDLVQEAQLRTLLGTRNCPVDVDVMKHLIDTMSSIADAERKKALNRTPHIPILQVAEHEAMDPPSLDWSAEDQLIYAAVIDELLGQFPDDVVAREMVESIIAGFETEEIKQLTGLQGTAYNSKRTLVRRRLLKFSKRREDDRP
jgi:hypothetical protein